MSGAPDRLTRVNELIKREMSELITRYSIAPSPSMLVSVTEVRTSVDLRNATVSISIFGGKKQGETAEMYYDDGLWFDNIGGCGDEKRSV